MICWTFLLYDVKPFVMGDNSFLPFPFVTGRKKKRSSCWHWTVWSCATATDASGVKSLPSPSSIRTLGNAKTWPCLLLFSMFSLELQERVQRSQDSGLERQQPRRSGQLEGLFFESWCLSWERSVWGFRGGEQQRCRVGVVNQIICLTSTNSWHQWHNRDCAESWVLVCSYLL